jgi:hypothetical protein
MKNLVPKIKKQLKKSRSAKKRVIGQKGQQQYDEETIGRKKEQQREGEQSARRGEKEKVGPDLSWSPILF